MARERRISGFCMLKFFGDNCYCVLDQLVIIALSHACQSKSGSGIKRSE